MTYLTTELDLLVQHELARNVAEGFPPRSISAWCDECRRDYLESERLHPGYISRAAAGIEARAVGRRVTGWRETRGTHGIDYIPDPKGTDRPPWA